jgi:hypothetical protein
LKTNKVKKVTVGVSFELVYLNYNFTNLELEDEQQDMHVDVQYEPVRVVEHPKDELIKAFEESGVFENQRQIMTETDAPLFGGTPIYYQNNETEKRMFNEPQTEKSIEASMDDEEMLNTLLNIKSFKDIHKSLLKKKTRVQIEEDISKIPPIYKEKRFKTHHDSIELESCMVEPLNLSYIYSNQYNEKNHLKYMTLSSKSKKYASGLGPVAKWPYKTLTERLIIHDIFLMLKGLKNVNFAL